MRELTKINLYGLELYVDANAVYDYGFESRAHGQAWITYELSKDSQATAIAALKKDRCVPMKEEHLEVFVRIDFERGYNDLAFQRWDAEVLSMTVSLEFLNDGMPLCQLKRTPIATISDALTRVALLDISRTFEAYLEEYEAHIIVMNEEGRRIGSYYKYGWIAPTTDSRSTKG